MKKLMFLISTEGKTTEQISKESWEAYQKYQRVSKKVEEDQLKTAGEKEDSKATKKPTGL
jgi:hypothetical protein